jgi:hypothetical protein
MAAFNVVPLAHAFVAGRGQDFADLVDELLSGTSEGSYDAVAEACILGPLQATALRHPARMHLGLLRSVRCWTTPADLRYERAQAGAPEAATNVALAALLLGVTVAMSVMSSA